jgi:hypothetical protein
MYFWEAQRARGARVHMVPNDDAVHVNTERLLAAIDEETLLVPISHVIFRSSFIQDVPPSSNARTRSARTSSSTRFRPSAACQWMSARSTSTSPAAAC